MKKILYALVLGMFFYGCASDEEVTPTTGTIVGSVSDYTTGEPVATVNVSLFSAASNGGGYYGDGSYGGGYGDGYYDDYYGGGYYDDYYYGGYNKSTRGDDDNYMPQGGQSAVTGSDGSFNYPDLEPGDYTIYISKEGYEITNAQFTVTAGQSTTAHLLIKRIPATIEPDRESLDFGSNESFTMSSFVIVNTNYATLEYTIEYDCPWIKEVKPATGSLGTGKTGTIVVNIDRSKLSGGSNVTKLVVVTNNGRAEIILYAIGVEKYLPKLKTLDATDIDVLMGSAVLHGTVEDLGNPTATEQGFVYGLLSAPTVDDNKVVSSRTAKGAYSEKISNLPLDKTIYFRAYAISESGISYSDESVHFTTNAIVPQVTTMEAQDVDIANGTATLVGRIDNTGSPAYTERGFVYSTMHDPTVNDNKIVANGSGISGRFSLYATGLPVNRTIYVRAYATSERAGTVYGEEIVIGELDCVVLQAAGIAVQKQDLGKGNWSTANSMCENSIVGGYTDWRLPTKDELMVLYNNRELIGGFDLDYAYWSSDEYYFIQFWTGKIVSSKASVECMVRAVRTISK